MLHSILMEEKPFQNKPLGRRQTYKLAGIHSNYPTEQLCLSFMIEDPIWQINLDYKYDMITLNYPDRLRRCGTTSGNHYNAIKLSSTIKFFQAFKFKAMSTFFNYNKFANEK